MLWVITWSMEEIYQLGFTLLIGEDQMNNLSKSGTYMISSHINHSWSIRADCVLYRRLSSTRETMKRSMLDLVSFFFLILVWSDGNKYDFPRAIVWSLQSNSILSKLVLYIDDLGDDKVTEIAQFNQSNDTLTLLSSNTSLSRIDPGNNNNIMNQIEQLK